MTPERRLFESYMAGWVAGAGVKVYAATDWDAAEYERGYTDGRQARREASETTAARVGCHLATVRTMGTENT